ncbi:MAG: DUF4911 domain-containing protein [Thermodesulfobacteriota bacterium]
MKTIRKCFRIGRRDISFLKYVFEAWEGLAMVSTLDAGKGIVALIVAPGSLPAVEEIVSEMARQILLEEIPDPGEKESIWGA